MRNGSVAIVPLFLGIMLLFWFMAIMGGGNDTLHSINNIENLQHLQKKLLVSAMKKRYELSIENPSWSETRLDNQVNLYINTIMVTNEIQK